MNSCRPEISLRPLAILLLLTFTAADSLSIIGLCSQEYSQQGLGAQCPYFLPAAPREILEVIYLTKRPQVKGVPSGLG